MGYLKVLKGSALLTSGNLVSGLIGLVRLAFITRFISVLDYGIFSLAIGTSSLFTSFSMPQYRSVITRYFPEYRENNLDEAKRFVFSSLFFSILFSLTIFILLELFAEIISVNYYTKQGLTPYLKVAAITIPVIAHYSITRDLLISLERFKIISIGQIVVSVLNLLLTVSFLLAGLGIKGIIYSLILSKLIVSIYFTLLLKDWILVAKPKLSKRILKFWYPIGVASYLKTLTVNLPILIIGRFLPFEAAGFYNISKSTAGVVFSFFGPYIDSLNVICMNTYQRSKAEFSRILNLGIKHQTVAVVIIAGIVLFFPGYILSILYSAKYIPAASLFSLLIVYYGLSQLNFFQGPVLFAHERSRIYLYSGIISIILEVILFLIFVPLYELTGIGYALIAVGLFTLTWAITVSLYVGEKIKIMDIFSPITISILLFLPLHFIAMAYEPIYSFIFAALFGLIYLIVLGRMGFIEWREMMSTFHDKIYLPCLEKIQCFLSGEK